jgi:carbon storage regulator
MSRLVLSRSKDEKIRVGDAIEITVLRVTGDRVRLGVEAPPEMLVLRHELAGRAPDSSTLPAPHPPAKAS